MQIRIVIDCDLSFQSGKFASREDIEQAIIDNEINEPGEVEAGEGTYVVDSWDVSESDDPGGVKFNRLLIAARSLSSLNLPNKGELKNLRKALAAFGAVPVLIEQRFERKVSQPERRSVDQNGEPHEKERRSGKNDRRRLAPLNDGGATFISERLLSRDPRGEGWIGSLDNGGRRGVIKPC